MAEHINMALNSIFVENMLLAYFLGMCSFLAVSKKVSTASGLGVAVIFVLTLTCPVNWLVNEYFLKEGALAWTGSEQLAALDLSYLRFLTFIAVIAAMVQVVEMFIEKTSDSLYNALGIFLPLITVNCAILGASLFQIDREYTLVQSVNFGFSSGIGWFLAIVLLAAIRQRLRYSHIPRGLRGLGITMLVTGLMAMAFMAFAGIDLKGN
ncbi:MAG: NADH:ubiquinone reductase (Na(+)-transporting) subunit E [Lentisphaeria bacterium]|nr:NADH:ubiquinone reductase (Na(+)-transporting) subunit E [Lentisphaeria bacterium]